MARIDEERTDASGIDGGVEPGIVADLASVAAEQRLASAPAAAADDLAGFGFDDEVGLISNQRGVHAERAEQRGFDLFGRVVARAQLANGARDQVAK